MDLNCKLMHAQKYEAMLSTYKHMHIVDNINGSVMFSPYCVSHQVWFTAVITLVHLYMYILDTRCKVSVCHSPLHLQWGGDLNEYYFYKLIPLCLGLENQVNLFFGPKIVFCVHICKNKLCAKMVQKGAKNAITNGQIELI